MGAHRPGQAHAALAQAFTAVEQLAHPVRRVHGCTCPQPGAARCACLGAWVARAGDKIAVVRQAWLDAGLPPQAS